MREALYRFIHARYTEVLAALPVALLLIGLLIAVGIDSYIQKRQKRIMLIICALVFSLIAQNLLDHLLTVGRPRILLRRVVDIYGYSIRPVILLLFLYIVSPKKPGRAGWILIGANAAIHLTALFTDICFTIDGDNLFQGGWPVLKDSCLITSLILLGQLVYSMFRNYRSSGHIGIRNVRERLEKQCGGTLTLESRPGEGTTVTLFVPRMKDEPAGQGGRAS